MNVIDYLIFALYMAGVLSIGVYHFRRNKDTEDYYVGGRAIKAHHVGLSIVATDVGGGFSIGLGGVGFMMGLAGSWLLFTGLVGAWLSAVLIIPRIKRIDTEHGMMTYPDFLRHRYNAHVAMAAALISGIGYLGFTGAQMLAGAKLASATILRFGPLGMSPLLFALLVIAVITVLYTVIGGLKAVIYTDTVQWLILLTGLIAVTIPVTLFKIGGWAALRAALPPEHFSLTNISAVTFINWMVTIIPIWLVGMTLYQRMYACKDEREAKRAWYIAGFFEYPIMAFSGVFLGMCARVMFPDAESEMALPLLIRDVLPVGVTGIVIAAYFSAIMSTADSCLMASSGNFVNDLLERYCLPQLTAKQSIRLSMLATLAVGVGAVLLAAQFTMVLDAILYAYAFMVSGLFIPTLGAYFWRRGSSAGALAGMLGGGLLTLLLLTKVIALPAPVAAVGFDASLYGIALSAVLYVAVSLLVPDAGEDTAAQPAAGGSVAIAASDGYDKVEAFQGALIQHGPCNDRVYLMKLKGADPEQLVPALNDLAAEKGYTKIFAKVPAGKLAPFTEAGYVEEARIPRFYSGAEDAAFLGYYLDEERAEPGNAEELERVLQLAEQRQAPGGGLDPLAASMTLRPCTPDDVEPMSAIYRTVFPSYPFPIHDTAYLAETMKTDVRYFGILADGGQLVALSSSEMERGSRSVEMTDFATLPDWRGHGFAVHLLEAMESEMRTLGMKTAFTIARAVSPGMNITFAKSGYEYGGRLINNTDISGHIESMNVWHKAL